MLCAIHTKFNPLELNIRLSFQNVIKTIKMLGLLYYTHQSMCYDFEKITNFEVKTQKLYQF